MKVGFLLPNNTRITMAYEEVELFCKNICLQEENQAEFKKFSRRYKYFSPYFDFVTQKLGYFFLNPLFLGNTILVFRDGAYYLVSNEGEDYQTLLMKESTVYKGNSFMTACSNKELKISMATLLNMSSAMIDPNKVRMMSHTGIADKDGSHTVTCNTVLNQIMLSNPTIVEHIESLLPMDYVSYSLNYLSKYLGFLHFEAKNKMLLGNKDNLSDVLKSFKDDALEYAQIKFVDWKDKNDFHFSEDYRSNMHFRR